MNRIRFVGEALFIPFFLIATGMLVDLRALMTEQGSWMVAGLMVVTVVATKGLAAWTTTPLFRYGHVERQVVFALTVPQAAATLAAVLVGYQVGLVGTAVINGAILMILVTCLLGPWMADRYGRRLAAHEAAKPLDPGAAPQRILVPLANPTSVAHIMDVATLIRDAKLDQPLYPITIAREGPEVVEEVVRSERVLAQAVLHGAAADVPVHPITRVEINVARGLRRAIQETRSTVVVMGWDALPVAERFIFGSISDQLLAEGRVLLLLCRLVQPPGQARRMVLVVPPLAEREPGCAGALHVARTLSRQAAASLVVLAAPAQLPTLQDVLERGKQALTVKTVLLDDWGSLVETLERHLQPDDVLLFLSARRGAMSWRSGLERLPQALARHFPDTSLIVLYPAAETLSPDAPSEAHLPTLVPDHIVFDLPDAPVDKVLRHLLRPVFEGRPQALEEAVAHLTVAEYLLDLTPGLAFCHARLTDLATTWLGIGVSRSGLSMPGARHRVNVLLVLLTPEDLSSEVHLQHLRRIAEWMQDQHVVEQLLHTAPREAADTLVREVPEEDGEPR